MDHEAEGKRPSAQWFWHIVRSKPFFVFQDVAVQLKAILASVAIIALMQNDRIMCTEATVYYCSGPSVVDTQMDYTSSMFLDLCEPRLLGLNNLIAAFIGFVVITQVLFAFAIVLKYCRLWKKNSLLISYIVSGTALSLAIGKVSIVTYNLALGVVFECPAPSTFTGDYCIERTTLMNITQFDHSCVDCQRGDCLRPHDCGNCYTSGKWEIYLLVTTFFLSAVYICYLAYEYHVGESVGELALKAIYVPEYTPLSESGCDGSGTPSAHEMQEVWAKEARKIRRRRVIYCYLQDFAALVKFLITSAALAVIMLTEETASCHSFTLPNTSAVISGRRIQAACDAQLDVIPFAYTFLILTAVFGCIFFVVIIFDKRIYFPFQAKFVALSLLSASVLLSAGQISMVCALYALTVHFTCKTNEAPPLMGVGLCTHRIITNEDLGVSVPEFEIPCWDTCRVGIPPATWSLLASICLTLVYVTFLVARYWKASVDLTTRGWRRNMVE